MAEAPALRNGEGPPATATEDDEPIRAKPPLDCARCATAGTASMWWKSLQPSASRGGG